MDIEGKHFPDDEELEYSKGKRIRKKIFKYIFYGTCFAVYLIMFIRFFLSCDADMLTKITLSPQAREMYSLNPEEFVVYDIHTLEFMNYDGTIQLKKNIYAQTANELEIGVRYNNKITADENGSTANSFVMRYTLTDNMGTSYMLCNRVSEERHGYMYERISFSGVRIDFQYNDMNNEKNEDDFYVDDTPSEKNKVFTLCIENTVTRAKVYLKIYDNATTYQKTDYNSD